MVKIRNWEAEVSWERLGFVDEDGRCLEYPGCGAGHKPLCRGKDILHLRTGALDSSIGTLDFEAADENEGGWKYVAKTWMAKTSHFNDSLIKPYKTKAALPIFSEEQRRFPSLAPLKNKNVPITSIIQNRYYMQQFLSIFDVFPMISPAASPSQAAYCALLGPKILKPAESGADESSARNGGGENHFKVRGDK